jgi:hypothetical protein
VHPFQARVTPLPQVARHPKLTWRVNPRIAMAILRHSRISLTMEVYTQVPEKVTRDALRRLSDWLDQTVPWRADNPAPGEAPSSGGMRITKRLARSWCAMAGHHPGEV